MRTCFSAICGFLPPECSQIFSRANTTIYQEQTTNKRNSLRPCAYQQITPEEHSEKELGLPVHATRPLHPLLTHPQSPHSWCHAILLPRHTPSIPSSSLGAPSVENRNEAHLWQGMCNMLSWSIHSSSIAPALWPRGWFALVRNDRTKPIRPGLLDMEPDRTPIPS